MGNKTISLPLEVGIEVSAELAGTKRTNFTLIGGLSGQYLILKPQKKDNLTGLANFQPDTRLVVRYIHEGYVYAFRSYILTYSSVPDKLLFIQYPQKIAEQTVRDSPRISCLLPAKLVCADKELSGTIIDVSDTGCSWRSADVVYQRRDEYDFSKASRLLINFPGENKPSSFECKNHNIRSDSILTCLGLEFLNLSEEAQKLLKEYLHLGYFDERILENDG